MSDTTHDDTAARRANFLTEIIDRDLAQGAHTSVVTRFPPEPNGYLHIGHAKSICLNFGLAADYRGRCHLRFDDTNPTTEDVEYVESIQADIRWLGFDWGEHLYFASDYFEAMYGYAVELIEKGLAYVDSQSVADIREGRGAFDRPGTPSPFRDRSVEENLDLFARMRAGEFEDGTHVLRARIDMASPNMIMRDPLLYRIRHAHHHRSGDAWCIYPMYDFAHCLEDAIEHVTHSICTLEFENNRELYDWVLDNVSVPARPHQYEFARLNLGYTVMSKRKLLLLVREGIVSGWDDPRMPTIAGLRRRGVTPEAIRAFADMIGVAKNNSLVDIGKLEYCVRDDLNHRAPRTMAVLDPLEMTLTNVSEGHVEMLDAPLWPDDVPRDGSRMLPFPRTVYIERADFSEDPPKGFKRLSPGASVRLRHATIIRCDEVERDADGRVVRLLCTAAPADATPRGVIHWVPAAASVEAEVRLYDRLFSVEQPGASESVDFRDEINPDSLRIVRARIEPALAAASAGERFQFERQGYFVVDTVDSVPGAPVFNRIVTLRDSWAKQTGTARPESERRERAASKPAPSAPAAPRETERDIARRDDPALAARYAELVDQHGVAPEHADLIAGSHAVADWFDAAAATGVARPALARWTVSEALPAAREGGLEALSVSPGAFARLVELVESDVISATAGSTVFAAMLAGEGDADAIVAARGLEKVADTAALATLVADVIAQHPDEVARYRDGKTALLGFFVGAAMRASGGSADAGALREVLKEALEG